MVASKITVRIENKITLMKITIVLGLGWLRLLFSGWNREGGIQNYCHN